MIFWISPEHPELPAPREGAPERRLDLVVELGDAAGLEAPRRLGCGPGCHVHRVPTASDRRSPSPERCRMADLAAAVSRLGGRGAGLARRRGRSGLHRAGCSLTASQGDLQESATESRPPMAGRPAQARVKGCGKSAPASRGDSVGSVNPTRSKVKRGTRAARPSGRPDSPQVDRSDGWPPILRIIPGGDRTPPTGRLTAARAAAGP